jgi:F-type H+-transporting ATPase subunit epsilon
MKFNVVTPTGSIVDTEVFEVTVPGALGELCILPAHRPAVLMVGGGRLTYVTGSAAESLFVKGGIVEVGPDHVTVLTDIALDESQVAEGGAPAGRDFVDVDYLTDELSLRMGIEQNFLASIEGI